MISIFGKVIHETDEPENLYENNVTLQYISNVGIN